MTVREWFRLVRLTHNSETREETALLWALRNQDWRLAEFWALLLLSMLDSGRQGVHVWTVEEYVWECASCKATIPRDIDETDPPEPDPECHCRACLPCQGDDPCSI
jgi:hypothetical protein